MRQRHRGAIGWGQRACPRQQQVVAGLVGFEVRCRDEKKRLRVVGEPLTTAEWTLQMLKQSRDAIEIGAGLVVIPRSHRDERKEIEKVVIERQRQGLATG